MKAKKILSVLWAGALSITLLGGCGGTAGGTADTALSSENTEQTAMDNNIVSGDTPFSRHGALSVSGSDLVDSKGEKYQLYGMSTHGIGWFPKYVTEETFVTLRDDWNTNAIRLAMYVAENGGYCTDGDKAYLKTLVKNGVEYATDLGMYVIIDWHVLREESPLANKDEAVKFFDEMSALYADNDNVIYEICNEPNGSTTWADVKEYANEVIPVIRANDENSLVIVGTPSWSQEIDKAAKAPLEFDNVMYALHFYAATHTDWLRDRLKACMDGGLPVFISEFGTCDASGNGAIDYAQSDEWKKVIDEYNVSYFCWNLANNNETSSVISNSCDKVSGWTEDELSDEGKQVSAWFKEEPNQ